MTADSHSRPDLLDEVLAAYLRAIENGENPSRDDLLAKHPDLASELQEFFADHDRMNRLAQPLCEQTLISPAVAAAERIRYFGDYEVLEEIARGGMGVVFRARQVTLNRIVAIKMILSGRLASPADVERFHTEAEAAAKLDHPGIVPIYEVGQHEGQHYFSMGFVDGISLSAKVAQGPLPAREAAELVRTVADAVQYAHDKGVIHRDLKPGNILLDKQGKPRVTDFGLAKLTESHSDLTGTGQILGTPGYMPPEQAAGKTDQNGPASDVYSLGAILYCLLTGRPPFQAATPLDTLRQVLEQDPVSARQLNAQVPLDLETIALKCLEKDPRRRYRTARELADELRRFLAGEPIRARPVRTWERAVKWGKRYPARAAVLAVSTLVSAIFVAVLIVSDVRLREAKHGTDMALEKLSATYGELQAAKDEAEDLLDGETRARESAELQKRISDVLRISAQAREALKGTPERSLLLAAAAVESAQKLGPLAPAAAEQALRDILASVGGKLLRSPSGAFQHVSATPDGRWLMTGGEDAVRLWDLTSTDPAAHPVVLPGTAGLKQPGVVSSDGRWLVTPTSSPPRLWNLLLDDPSSSPRDLVPPHDSLSAVTAEFSPDGRWLRTLSHGAIGQQAFLWDLNGPDQRQPFAGPLGNSRFSLDGRWLLVSRRPGTLDATTELWDLAAPDPSTGVATLTELASRTPNLLEFSPRGDRLVAVCGDPTALVWTLGREPGPIVPCKLPLKLGGQRKAEFSPDGLWLILGTPMDGASLGGSMQLWNLKGIEQQSELANPAWEIQNWMGLAWFSSDSRWLFANQKQSGLWLRDLSARDGKQFKLTGHTAPVTAGSLNRGLDAGRCLMTIGGESACLWDTGQTDFILRPVVLPGQFVPKSENRFSHNGRLLLLRRDTKSMLLWSRDKKQQYVLSGHVAPITSEAFSADGKWLATGGADGTVRLWNLTAADPSAEPVILRGHENSVDAVVFGPTSRWLVTIGHDRSSRLWDLSTQDLAATPVVLHGEIGRTSHVAFSGNCGRLLAVRTDAAHFWDLPVSENSGKKLVFPKSTLESVVAVFLDRRGAIACRDGRQLDLWDLSSSTPTPASQVLSPLSSTLTVAALSRDWHWLAAGCGDGGCRLWCLDDTATTSPRHWLTGHGGPVWAVAFSADHRWLATGGEDHQVRLWDTAAEDPASAVVVLSGHTGPICALAFSADGHRMFSGSHDETVRVWELPAVSTGPQSKVLPGHQGSVRSLAASADGRWLVTAGSDDRSPRVWDLMAADPAESVRTLDGHEHWVTCVGISSDSRWIASAGYDHTARLWPLGDNLPRSEPIVLRGSPATIRTLDFSPDGQWLATAGDDASARLYHLRRSDLVGLARRMAGRELSRDEELQYLLAAGEPTPVSVKPKERPSRAAAPPGRTSAEMQPSSPVSGFIQATRSTDSSSLLDWPALGGTPSRNHTAPQMRVPIHWDVTTGENIKWSTKLGSQTYTSPVIAGGKVFIGTNNGMGYIKRYPNKIDLGVLLCFEAETGNFLWQHSNEKLAVGRGQDWELLGVCSTPCVEGERLWYVSNRNEVVCLDVEGFRDGENDGPFRDEPSESLDEADVVWKFDMIAQLGATPHNAARCAVIVVGDLLFVSTSNGVDEAHKRVAHPEAASFVVLRKDTGEVVWSDDSPGENTLHGQWGSPAYGVIDGVAQVLFPGGDGWLYSFDPLGDNGRSRLLWKFDCNPKESVYMLERATRNPLLSEPVISGDRVYIAVGEDPEHGEGHGHLWCIEPGGHTGDVSSQLVYNVKDPTRVIPHKRIRACEPEAGDFVRDNPNSAALWHYVGANTRNFEQTMHRAMVAPAIDRELLFICDQSGMFHCLDARTGVAHWTHDVLAACWSSPLIVGDFVYQCDSDGDIAIFRVSQRKELVDEPNIGTTLQSSLAVANNVLYVATFNTMYAITAGATSLPTVLVPPVASPPTTAPPLEPSIGAWRTLPGHTGPVWGVAFAPDSGQLASSSDDMTILLWNPQSGEGQKALLGHTSPVRSVTYSHDGSTLASTSFDKTIRFWDAATGAALDSIEDTGLGYFPVFTRDDKTLVTGSFEASPRMWNVAERKLIRKLDGHPATAWAVAIARDRQLMATGGLNSEIRIWDATDGNPVRTIPAGAAGLNALALSPDGNWLAAAGRDNKPYLWNLADGDLLRMLPLHNSTLYDVAFAPDGKSLATACGDGFVRLWDVATGERIATFAGGGLCVAFSPDGKLLASGGADHTVRIWEVPVPQPQPLKPE